MCQRQRADALLSSVVFIRIGRETLKCDDIYEAMF